MCKGIAEVSTIGAAWWSIDYNTERSKNSRIEKVGINKSLYWKLLSFLLSFTVCRRKEELLSKQIEAAVELELSE